MKPPNRVITFVISLAALAICTHTMAAGIGGSEIYQLTEQWFDGYRTNCRYSNGSVRQHDGRTTCPSTIRG